MLLGLVAPDAGEILIDGRPVAIHDPIEAARLGHRDGAPALQPHRAAHRVGERDARRAGPRRRASARSGGCARRPSATGSTSTRTRGSTTSRPASASGSRSSSASCAIPTSSSSTSRRRCSRSAESLELFGVLRTVVQDENRAVHPHQPQARRDPPRHRPGDDHARRRGRRAASTRRTTDADELAREMIGRDVSLRPSAPRSGTSSSTPRRRRPTSPRRRAPVVLSIRDATRDRAPTAARCSTGSSLDVRRGEIVGLAGSRGQRAEDARRPAVEPRAGSTSGSVEVDGDARRRAGGRARWPTAGVGVIPEDRHARASIARAVGGREPRRSATSSAVCSGPVREPRAPAHVAREQLVARVRDHRPSSVDAPMRSLSGGNQQRVVLARELSRAPAVLVAAQPTRGLDVGAIEYMTQRLRAAAASGHRRAAHLDRARGAPRARRPHRGDPPRSHRRRDGPRRASTLERLGLMMGGQRDA